MTQGKHSWMADTRREWLLGAVSVSFGLMVFQVGFRLTFEVLPVLAVLVIGSLVFGFLLPRHPWLWGLGIGIGTLPPTRPLSQEHIQHEGPSRPLPLPFGLTDSSFAQGVAGSLIIMAFPFVGAMLGWGLAKLFSSIGNGAAR
jgi:hypothetical protein